MIALEVKKGTRAKVIRDGVEWVGDYWKEHTVTQDLLFFAEDIAIDPIGKLSPIGGVTIGGAWAKAGYYGFRRDGWYLMVPFHDVVSH